MWTLGDGGGWYPVKVAGILLVLAALQYRMVLGVATEDTRVFLTVKSASVASLSLPDVSSAFVIVTDLMISPGGQPLPFLNGESEFVR